ncbi:LCP family protein [Aeromicrobium sp. CF3.5]|uniref:LCP family protein n=1 Tax=Aeromicrobium sp. CF3.5 TaxID=3373078 RepID=UPI003EE4DDA0
MARHADADADPDATEAKRPGFIRRHRGLFITLMAFILIPVLAAGVFAVVLNSSLGDVQRVPVTVTEDKRPAVDDNENVNILLLGADTGSDRDPGGTSILDDAASGDWPTGKYRSDATMLVHIDADREAAYVVSIPRDSYVPVFDEQGDQQETTKINAALSMYGPSGAISTVENLADQRIDHLAMVDWDGFKDITDSLGGVEITTDQDGTRTLDGDGALEYVRERYNLPGGDFDRAKRQQNFLRSMMSAVLDRGTLTNPLRLRSTVSSIANNMAVDDGWSNGDIRSLAVSMRGIRPADVTFMTIPTNGTSDDPVAGSIVNVDSDLSERLFSSMTDDTVDSFVADHPELLLGSADQVD